MDIPSWLLPLAEKLILGVATIFTWLFTRYYAAERRALTDKLEQLELSIERLETDIRDRFARAGADTSDLATDVQGLPDKLRREWREDIDRALGNHTTRRH